LFTGWQKGDMLLSQSMVISALVIEAVIIGLALTMIIRIAKHSQGNELITERKSLDCLDK
jgi:multisubunit Na+/H+ antiporter MnhC subunit